MNGENKKSKENRKREENKKSIITSVFAVIILIGVFLIYSSYSKMLRLQAELKLQEAKEKIKKIEENEQKQAETQQNLQKDIQKVEETVANAVTQQTNYEEELMKRMSSVKDTDFEGSTAEMAEQAEKARKAWDDELNKVYKLLMSELSGEQKAKLQNSEREWIKNIEKEIEKMLDEECGLDEKGKRMTCGTVVVPIEAGTRMERTKERAIQLAKMYDEIHKK
ncbi:hypothetical protein HMPREF1984_01356 [Leptotrichia sp. oral taxon 215 str. W9775]|jgi:hypothetical protein|uniref:lysozyme inhibitor LprI family protein n=1 Tax=Leptotrichia sp. oral taxon 215 TaxID=712359 RepID=UPI0003ADA1FD|nr:lysozyme inhibitor LprI family protein [Leptotrichia sp. oral taxon 215]ERK67052.1 hypothetical protein HMPREF1984_01356 [Leptotrichia sp. oral taxon 215 str. W9775]